MEAVFQEKFNEGSGMLEVEGGRKPLARAQVFAPAPLILRFTSWPNVSSLPESGPKKASF